MEDGIQLIGLLRYEGETRAFNNGDYASLFWEKIFRRNKLLIGVMNN